MLSTDGGKEQIGRGNLLNDAGFRAGVAQAVVLLLLVGAVWFFSYNVYHNLTRAGITTGFAFLSQPAGFDVSQSLIDSSSRSTYADALLVGILNTLLVSAMGIVCSTILGFFLGVIRLSPNWLVAKLAGAYTEIIRNIPLLLQILFWYLAILAPLPGPRLALHFGELVYLCNRGLQVPRPLFTEEFLATAVTLIFAVLLSLLLIFWSRRFQTRTGRRFPAYWVSLALLVVLPLATFTLTGSPLSWEIPTLSGFNFSGGITVLPELLALWLALTLYTATFIGEYVRSGIMAVDRGQIEAARALGHRPWMTYRLVVIPQAMRVVTPPLISQYLTLVKNSSLAVVIGYPDLVHVFAGTALNQSGQAVEIIAITMAVYLTISLLISLLMNWYNRAVAMRGGQ